MDMTMEKFDDLLRLTLEKAKTNRQKVGYSGADRFAQVALVIGPKLQKAVMPLQWSNNREERIVLKALSLAARSEGASAIVLITDARWLRIADFMEHFHLQPPSETGVEVWRAEYGRIMHEKYDDTMANLPRELWSEAVVVSGKGPLVGEKSVMAPYREGRNDSVEWTDTPLGPDDYPVLPLEDWWETPTRQ